MPLYEFHCDSCNATFEKLLKKQEHEVACPICGKSARKAVSVFASATCSSPPGSGFG
jgi:putative FmdB family regulatory protein